MRAMLLRAPAPVEQAPLVAVDLPDPRPGADEVLVEVSVCGVCRTDLHTVERDIPVPRLPIVPGHQVVGRVREVGADVTRFAVGDRVGVAWVHRFCGQCDACVEGRENLCSQPTFTGYHVHGGYAERIVAPSAFVHPLPDTLSDDVQAAPLLCGGIIGYRALKQSGLRPGARVALYGFGSSAHVALPIALSWGCEVYVVTRSADARARAADMGAAWTGTIDEPPPRPVDHAVSFAPAGSVIAPALEALRQGGTLALAGITVDRVPALDYDRHLFGERSLTTVKANTRADARELLAIAARVEIRTDVRTFALEDANQALAALKAGRLGAQAAVLTTDAWRAGGGA